MFYNYYVYSGQSARLMEFRKICNFNFRLVYRFKLVAF